MIRVFIFVNSQSNLIFLVFQTDSPSLQASVLMHLPFVRQFFLSLGSQTADRHNILKTLRKKEAVGLFPGGIAELFLSNHEKESIVSTHHGFIRVRGVLQYIIFRFLPSSKR
jgi:hypothetical protein